MATEEPSVVAAASNLAQVAREHGGFFCSADEPVMIAQVQVVGVDDPQGAKLRLFEHRDELLALANEQDPILVRFGGGARDIEVRVIEGPKGTHVVLHLLVNVGDAMGANAVNTMAEALAPRIAEIARGRVLLRILSNKADRRLARARAIFDAGKLGGRDVVDGDPRRLPARRRRPVPGRDAQQGHHERHQRRRPRDRQRHPGRRGRLPQPCRARRALQHALAHGERRRRQPRRDARAADARRPRSAAPRRPTRPRAPR